MKTNFVTANIFARMRKLSVVNTLIYFLIYCLDCKDKPATFISNKSCDFLYSRHDDLCLLNYFKVLTVYLNVTGYQGLSVIMLKTASKLWLILVSTFNYFLLIFILSRAYSWLIQLLLIYGIIYWMSLTVNILKMELVSWIQIPVDSVLFLLPQCPWVKAHYVR